MSLHDSHWPSPTAITKVSPFCSCRPAQKQHHLKMFTGQTGAKRREDSSTEEEQTFEFLQKYCWEVLNTSGLKKYYQYQYQYLLIKVWAIQQESLADAKVSARQQCVYEDPYRRNLQQICNWWLIVTVAALLTICELWDIFGCRGWKSPFSPTILWL